MHPLFHIIIVPLKGSSYFSCINTHSQLTLFYFSIHTITHSLASVSLYKFSSVSVLCFSPVFKQLSMENTEANKLPQDLPMKTQKHFYFAQLCLRISAIATTLSATSLMLTSRQSVFIFGTTFDAKYSYSSAFKFFVFGNAVACAFSVLSLFYVLIMLRKGSNPSHYFFLFIHDLLMMSLVLAACAAATAVGYIGKFGSNHIGWMAICDQFGKFCNKVTSAMIVSYLAFLLFLVLAIGNASRSRQVIS